MYPLKTIPTLLLGFFSILFVSCTKSAPDYSGTWIDSDEYHENILELTKLENSDNQYRFSINSWRDSYDYLVDDITRFLGGMDDSVCIIEVVDGQGMYSDDGREYEEGWGLYKEGEKRCSVMFVMSDTSIVLSTEACVLVYSGWGVSFDGVYHKVGE